MSIDLTRLLALAGRKPILNETAKDVPTKAKQGYDLADLDDCADAESEFGDGMLEYSAKKLEDKTKKTESRKHPKHKSFKPCYACFGTGIGDDDDECDECEGSGEGVTESVKSFAEYVSEAEGMETIGKDRNSAIQTIQNRMGTTGNQQAATQKFDMMKNQGVIKQDGSSMTMKSMDDDSFKAAIGEDDESAGIGHNGAPEVEVTLVNDGKTGGETHWKIMADGKKVGYASSKFSVTKRGLHKVGGTTYTGVVNGIDLGYGSKNSLIKAIKKALDK